MFKIYLGLGSNIGDLEKNLDVAKELLRKYGIQELRESKRYSSMPLYYKKQDSFLNSVIECYSHLNPYDLLKLCKKIESEMGRVSNFRNGPRLIDIDILLYQDTYILSSQLTIPHKNIQERDFVLIPLLDLEKDLCISGVSILDLLNNLNDISIIK